MKITCKDYNPIVNILTLGEILGIEKVAFYFYVGGVSDWVMFVPVWKGAVMKHNWFTDLRHWLFGHQVLWGHWVETEYWDGCSFHARCRYCGLKGMIDSQGNLF